MQTLTIQVTNNIGLKSLHALEEKHHIKIVDDANLDSPALPGGKLSLKAYKTWISNAENCQAFDLKDAKTKWTDKRKQLEKLTR